MLNFDQIEARLRSRGIACCSQFARALRAETDSEGYGALISALEADGKGSWCIGQELTPMYACPWCYTPLRDATGMAERIRSILES